MNVIKLGTLVLFSFLLASCQLVKEADVLVGEQPPLQTEETYQIVGLMVQEYTKDGLIEHTEEEAYVHHFIREGGYRSSRLESNKATNIHIKSGVDNIEHNLEVDYLLEKDDYITKLELIPILKDEDGTTFHGKSTVYEINTVDTITYTNDQVDESVDTKIKYLLNLQDVEFINQLMVVTYNADFEILNQSVIELDFEGLKTFNYQFSDDIAYYKFIHQYKNSDNEYTTNEYELYSKEDVITTYNATIRVDKYGLQSDYKLIRYLIELTLEEELEDTIE